VSTEGIIVRNQGIRKIEKWSIIVINRIADKICMLLIPVGEFLGNIQVIT
jgi:hypothetical protein